MQLFVLPPERLPLSPKRTRFGVDVVRDGLEVNDTAEVSEDDLDDIEVLPESPEVDPIDVFLKSDLVPSEEEDFEEKTPVP